MQTIRKTKYQKRKHKTDLSSLNEQIWGCVEQTLIKVQLLLRLQNECQVHDVPSIESLSLEILLFVCLKNRPNDSVML